MGNILVTFEKIGLDMEGQRRIGCVRTGYEDKWTRKKDRIGWVDYGSV